MQSRLPDVNTAFIKHRNGVIEGLGSRNYDKVFGSLYSWNALLPKNLNDDGTPKYRVQISDILYNKLTKLESYAICGHCEQETDFSKLKVFEMIAPLVEGVVSGNKTNKVWICPKCKEDNKLLDTVISETKLKEPYFLGVVPKPPRRQDGLNDRFSYDRKIKQWAWNFISELEEKSTQFREDYKENVQNFEDYEEIDGGEESE